MNDIASAETILPPVGQHIAEMTRALVERKANGTDESARIKIGAKGSANIRRESGGDVTFFLHDGVGVGCTMVRDAEEARGFAEALTAFADAIDPKAA